MEAIVDTDKSLLLTRCPPLFDPRQEPLRISYLLRELEGHPVQLVIRSKAAPEPPVHRRGLAPVATIDGPHELEWDGIDDSTGEIVKYSAAPFTVELIHDASYRAMANCTIPEPNYRVDYADVHFPTDREILLPGAEEGNAAPYGPRSGSLEVLQAILTFGADHPERRVVVYGHTDTSGSGSHNLGLSKDRARNVYLYLTGDRDGWATHAQDHYEVADFKRVHAWAAARFGWATDPGAIDNEWTSKARIARNAFRTRCSELFNIELKQGVKQNSEDWKAIFSLYDTAIAERLGCSPEDLKALRNKLTFADPGYVGCGEHWPTTSKDQNTVAGRVDRRVEIVLFETDELPDAHGSDDPPGSEFYGSDRYWTTRIKVNRERSPNTLHIQLFDPFNRRVSNAQYRVRAGEETFTGNAPKGLVTVELSTRPSRCVVEWSSGDAPKGTEFEHRLELFVDYDTVDDPAEQAKRRLVNLGYLVDLSKPLQDQPSVLRRFQHCTQNRYGLSVTGKFDDQTQEAIADSHDYCNPVETAPPDDDPQHGDDDHHELDYDFYDDGDL